MVGEPATVLDARAGQRLKRLRWIADTVDTSAESEFPDRLDQELTEFGGALPVTPVSDPDQFALALRFAGVEHRCIGGFVPGPDPAGPPAPQVDLADHLAECQHAIVSVEFIGGHFPGCRDAAVMSIVEEQNEPPALGAAPSQAPDQFRFIPFMHQHQVRSIQRLVQIQRPQRIGCRPQIGKRIAKLPLRHLAVLPAEVRNAPAPLRLTGAERVSAPDQFPGDTAQEVSVAVVPIRNERVTEENDSHGFSCVTASTAGPVGQA